MKKLVAIGEALIDFIPSQPGKSLKDVEDFKPAVGGAPANVCGAFRKLGGQASFITQIGEDAFGDKIVEEFEHYGICTEYVKRTAEANTCLAFVSLKEDGNRDFSFYRKPSADMLLNPDEIKKEWFEGCYALHFCSVSLGDFPMKEAHKKALEFALENKVIISFDPNVRLPLWEKVEDCREAILEFLPYAHIVKISDEELEFITGYQKIEEALPFLFQGNVELVIYTKGSEGAEAYTKNTKAFADSKKVKAVDTTGAGDGFIGSFLYQLFDDNVELENISALTEEALTRYLKFSNAFSGYSVQKKGAIASYPTKDEILK